MCNQAKPDAPHVDVAAWRSSGYRPTPTIIEAAEALYRNHAVEEISRSDAGAKNLQTTSDKIAAIIDRSKSEGRKSICFITGVPGAGKTLAGLNIAAKRSEKHEDEHAVFLSGNGPLVDVLREALAAHDGLADFAFAMQGLGSGAITLGGSDALRTEWLPRVASGSAASCCAGERSICPPSGRN